MKIRAEHALKGLPENLHEVRQKLVESWSPPDLGPIEIKINADGRWFYQDSEIKRVELMKLFASILRREKDGQYALVTPVEKRTITVEDAPFLAVSMQVSNSGEQQNVHFISNFDDEMVVSAAHPLRFVPQDDRGTVKPYVTLRNGLEALVTRAVFYDLVALGKIHRHHGEDYFGVMSSGIFWPMAKADEIDALGV